MAPPPVLKKRRRYRKQYPGEKQGITEEMRFVAMKLRESSRVKPRTRTYPGISELKEDVNESGSESDEREREGDETWQPSMDGFVKYLVDSKLVFDFIERVVDESSDVSCEFLVIILFVFRVFIAFSGLFVWCCARIYRNLSKMNVLICRI